MGTLHNKYGKEDLVKKLELEHFKRKTISFYRYVHIKDPEILRDELYEQFDDLAVLGRIYLAKEGINAQINVPETSIAQFVDRLNQRSELSKMPLKIAIEESGQSFLKLKIKVRNKILADGMDDNSYDVTNVGNHLSAKEWNFPAATSITSDRFSGTEISLPYPSQAITVPSDFRAKV